MYHSKRGKSFYPHAHDASGKQISLGSHASKKDAEAARRKYLTQRDDGTAALHSRLRIATLWPSYDAHLTARFEAGELTTNSVTLARQNWRNWIEPNLSDVRVKDMSKAKVLEFVDAMRGKLAAASQRAS
jgi:hypothetical protein